MVGISKEVVLSPGALARALTEQRVTTLFLTTALFNQMALDFPGAFAGMREVLFGGEAVDPRRVRAVMVAGGPERLLHVYGPTEATTFATYHEVLRVDENSKTIPIGKPIGNTEALILDERLEVVSTKGLGQLAQWAATGSSCLSFSLRATSWSASQTSMETVES